MIGYFYYKLELKDTPLRMQLNRMQNGTIQLVRAYTPIDDAESTASVYHIELGFLRGSSTIEVSDRIVRKNITQDVQYEGIVRIIGKKRAVKKTAEKLEEMCAIKLILDEMREKD